MNVYLIWLELAEQRLIAAQIGITEA